MAQVIDKDEGSNPKGEDHHDVNHQDDDNDAKEDTAECSTSEHGVGTQMNPNMIVTKGLNPLSNISNLSEIITLTMMKIQYRHLLCLMN